MNIEYIVEEQLLIEKFISRFYFHLEELSLTLCAVNQ